MKNLLSILPLAFVMIAGPQIISAVFLATSDNWRRNSAAYVAGALLSITLFVSIAFFVTGLLKSAAGDSHERTAGDAIDVVVLLLLLYLVVHVFLKRKTAEPPKWMGKLESATPKFSFTLGFLLLGVFPTDIVTSTSVGAYLARNSDPWWHCLPFVFLTLLLLALPALLLLMLGGRARAFLPRARNWMNTNSWVVSEIVIVFFLAMTVNNLASS